MKCKARKSSETWRYGGEHLQLYTLLLNVQELLQDKLSASMEALESVKQRWKQDEKSWRDEQTKLREALQMASLHQSKNSSSILLSQGVLPTHARSKYTSAGNMHAMCARDILK